MIGRVHQLAISPGGVPKRPIDLARIDRLGLAGDAVAHPRFHGGPERAVCLYSLDLIHALQADGHPIYPGSTGENVTIAGLDWAALARGCQLALGAEVIVEITEPAVPCKQIRGSFADRDPSRLSAVLHPGAARLYARVVRPGVVRVDDPVTLR